LPAVRRYKGWFDIWTDYPQTVERLAADPRVVAVCDLGGGATPVLSLEFVATHGLRYDVVDVSAAELEKTPAGYTTIEADALDPGLSRRCGPYDLVTSGFVAEHVPDPAAFHANVRAILKPGGLAVHAFPTLYEPTFVVNRLLPQFVSGPLLRRIQQGREDEGEHGKFRALYRWCRGPTRRQVGRLRAAGFEVVDYVGYFGHGYFYKLGPIDRLEQRFAKALERHPVAALTSYACVTLRRRD
jgi:2-polyprenyl-3-methyl-5-hydroxy-6-metoxy-1,4-benzoquinol methylase